jgi:hypothetical protein
MGSDGDPLEQLRRALDRLVELDPAALADGQAMLALHRQAARLEAVATRAAAAFAHRGDWRADGARTPAAWLAARCSLPEATARRRVRLGRDVPHLPVAERAWLDGDIASSAVELLARARNETTAARLAADEPELVDGARRLHPRTFARVVAYWRHRADPDGVEHEGAALHDGRRVHLSSSFAGTWFLDGVLDPVGGEVVATALARAGDELFRADWAAARAEHGAAATVEHLRRTPAQRRADALVAVCQRAGAVPQGARTPRPLFTVHVDHGTLGRICELARSRTVVAPGALVPWLTDAHVQRVVFDGTDRPVGVGRTRRFFTGADRTAVEARDLACFHPLCDVPAEDCEVDHVVPFAAGGPATADNGRLACGFHNRSRPGATRPERSETDDEDERGPP